MHEDEVAPDPVRQFARWFEGATDHAVCLVTASDDGRPTGRMVLLRGFDHRGFCFFTNTDSAKARDLTANPQRECA